MVLLLLLLFLYLLAIYFDFNFIITYTYTEFPNVTPPVDSEIDSMNDPNMVALCEVLPFELLKLKLKLKLKNDSKHS
jgi:hypothetical protein